MEYVFFPWTNWRTVSSRVVHTYTQKALCAENRCLYAGFGTAKATHWPSGDPSVCHSDVLTQGEISWARRTELHPTEHTPGTHRRDVWGSHCMAREGAHFNPTTAEIHCFLHLLLGESTAGNTSSTDSVARAYSVLSHARTSTPWSMPSCCLSCLLTGNGTPAGFPRNRCTFQSSLAFLLGCVFGFGRWEGDDSAW